MSGAPDMPFLSRFNPFSYLLRKVSNAAIAVLTKPLARYALTIPNDMAALKRNVRKGDVILIDGNERISECIKYLTQSSWSHSCLYVGDEPLKGDPALQSELIDKYGDEARHLVVEALVESGVVLTPLAKYTNFNLRICRPHGLSSADQKTVVAHALANAGRSYDFRNVFDLMRYFLPVHLVPSRMGRQALKFGGGDPTRVICSSLIAECFALVRFPIVPSYEPYPDGVAPKRPPAGLFRRFARQRPQPPGLLRSISPTLITPRDFDLSPYFAIIKYNVIENSRFDYHRLLWADAQPSTLPDQEEKSA